MRCQTWLQHLTYYHILWVHRNVTAHEKILPLIALDPEIIASSRSGGLEGWGSTSPGPQKRWLGDIQQDLGPGGGQPRPFACHLQSTSSALWFTRLQKPYCCQPSPASGAKRLGRSSPALTPGSAPASDLVTCFTLKWSCLVRHGGLSHLSSPSATPSSSLPFSKFLKQVRGGVVTLESAFYLAGKG